MLVGAHVSIAGGVERAPENAAALHCETFQFFSRSPRGGKPTPLTPVVVKKFKDSCWRYGFKTCYIHTPYYINFASTSTRIRQGSIAVVREELERGETLGVTATMTHIGSAKDIPEGDIVTYVSDALITMLKGYRGNNRFLLENAAGSGQVIGSSFVQLAAIIQKVEKKISHRLGICLDTAHAFASGYDLRTPVAVDKTFREFVRIIGSKRLVVMHANDSKVDFGSHQDRHENIGKGKIGTAGWQALCRYPRLQHTDFILETPRQTDRAIIQDIAVLKKLRRTK